MFPLYSKGMYKGKVLYSRNASLMLRRCIRGSITLLMLRDMLRGVQKGKVSLSLCSDGAKGKVLLPLCLESKNISL